MKDENRRGSGCYDIVAIDFVNDTILRYHGTALGVLVRPADMNEKAGDACSATHD